MYFLCIDFLLNSSNFNMVFIILLPNLPEFLHKNHVMMIVINMLLICQRIATIARDVKERGDVTEGSFGMTDLHIILLEAQNPLGKDGKGEMGG